MGEPANAYFSPQGNATTFAPERFIKDHPGVSDLFAKICESSIFIFAHLPNHMSACVYCVLYDVSLSFVNMQNRRLSLMFYNLHLFNTCVKPVGKIPVTLNEVVISTADGMNEIGDFIFPVTDEVNASLESRELVPHVHYEVLERDSVSNTPTRTRIIGILLQEELPEN